MTGSRAPLAERFATKIDRTEGGCWLWLGYVDAAGYGRIRLGGRGEPVGYAHRVSYEQHVGPVPDGHELDHLCRVRRCVCPTHLDPVPHVVNFARGAHLSAVTVRSDRCKRDHPFAANAYVSPTGRRSCRACRQIRRAEGAS